MIYLKWLLISLLKFPLLITVPLVAPILSIFTRPDFEEKGLYSWGGLFRVYCTFDNPPQGDRGWINKHCPFPGEFYGLKGYINRTGWIIRNPIYGFAKVFSIDYFGGDCLDIKGNPGISDKNKIPGTMFARLYDSEGKVKAFEFYAVWPWSSNRNLRMRFGWKIKTDKMITRGWARHVMTANPFDGYGERGTR